VYRGIKDGQIPDRPGDRHRRRG